MINEITNFKVVMYHSESSSLNDPTTSFRMFLGDRFSLVFLILKAIFGK